MVAYTERSGNLPGPLVAACSRIHTASDSDVPLWPSARFATKGLNSATTVATRYTRLARSGNRTLPKETW